jgi:hypothetical protein
VEIGLEIYCGNAWTHLKQVLVDGLYQSTVLYGLKSVLAEASCLVEGATETHSSCGLLLLLQDLKLKLKPKQQQNVCHEQGNRADLVHTSGIHSSLSFGIPTLKSKIS